ncbi:hypothetical protein ELY21_12695 [Legionella sp. km535]|uniref:hypothetical protein n=1 Tax=Legionella sp. km535 TaxID=2498107 RepID=UPI000F8F008B|nr:hypothetical protein [Legionella sp. km535]RUR16568.1 hypothetical protein ELY21_12695 [Legionella sp. km535]
MYDTSFSVLTAANTYPTTAVESSVITRTHPIDFNGIIGIYLRKSQLSVFIETKNRISAYKINPDSHQMGHWHTEILPRNSVTADSFDLLRKYSEHYAEVSEPLSNLEPFKEIMNQETLVGFSTLKDINNTIQLALSVLTTPINFEYNPTQ